MPIDPARLNAAGDLVLTEPAELRALADPLRLAVFDQVRRHGPATAAQVAQALGRPASSVEAGLAALASIGMVEPGAEGRWRAAVRGVYFEIPDDLDAQLAARELSNVMLAQYARLPAEWVRDQEPGLPVEWARAAGLLNAGVDLTADELRDVQAGLEQRLEPYTSRAAGEAPAGAARVRILAYFLPEPG